MESQTVLFNRNKNNCIILVINASIYVRFKMSATGNPGCKYDRAKYYM